MSDDEYDERPRKAAKTKKRKSRREEDDDEFEGAHGVDEDEFGGSPKKAKGLSAVSPAEQERLVGEVARFIVLSESTKTFTSRADVSRIVLTPQNYTRLAVPLLPLASAKLKRVFGWDMISVPTFTKKDFMAPVRDEMPTSVSQGFLMVVLAIILMNNFAIEDTVLMTMLRKYNLGGEEPLEQFENKRPIELIRELVKQHYLTMKREVEGDISSTFVTIGPRSLLEIGKSNILRFINEVCGTQPDTSALKALVEEEEEFLPSPALGAKDPTVRPAANGEQQAAPVEEIEEAQPNGVVANGAANGNHNAPAPDASQASQPTQRSRRSRGGR